MDYSNLANIPPKFNYDTSPIKENGYTKCFALDPRNELYREIIQKCEDQKSPYLIKEGKGKQKHIWIKGWKN